MTKEQIELGLNLNKEIAKEKRFIEKGNENERELYVAMKSFGNIEIYKQLADTIRILVVAEHQSKLEILQQKLDEL